MLANRGATRYAGLRLQVFPMTLTRPLFTSPHRGEVKTRLRLRAAFGTGTH
jgi:hypothetical protein